MIGALIFGAVVLVLLGMVLGAWKEAERFQRTGLMPRSYRIW